jgi:hypothetical protein
MMILRSCCSSFLLLLCFSTTGLLHQFLVLAVTVIGVPDANSDEESSSTFYPLPTATCYEVVDWLRDNNNNSMALPPPLQQQPPLSWTIHVHRNGEAASCGTASPITKTDLIQAILRRGENCAALDPHVFESVLTDLLRQRLTPAGACGSVANGEDIAADLSGFCDMGPARTVEQPDIDHLVRLSGTDTLPCRWRTRAGVRIATISQLLRLLDDASSSSSSAADAVASIDLYGVPAGRQFHFAPSHVGDVLDLPHCPCRLSVLSVTPAIFELHDFLTSDDTAEMVGPSAYFEGRSVIAFNEATPYAKNYRTSETGRLTNSVYQASIQQ